MDRHLTYQITEKEAGKSIEQFLRQTGCSHRVLTHLKRTERGIVRNGEWAYANETLMCGDVLEIHVLEEGSSDGIVPVKLPLSVVYEDEDLLIIDKPAGMPVHPSMGNYDNTLANAAVCYFQSEPSPFVFRCINRLDRDTSGLLILAKNMISGAMLYQMSSRREIHREYLAVACGVTPGCGTIDAPIARREGSVLMRCVDYERGERAVTYYERVLTVNPHPDNGVGPAAPCSHTAQSDNAMIPCVHADPNQCPFTPRSLSVPIETGLPDIPLSLLRIRLETGRTHQIRVHMAHIGHPLAGDFLYNPGSQTWIARQALHSHSLAFCHPVTGQELHFESPLPEDMKALTVR